MAYLLHIAARALIAAAALVTVARLLGALMNTNKFILLFGATLIAGVLCVLSAVAEIAEPADAIPTPQPQSLRAYHSLTSVELSEARQPKFQNGMSDLSRSEARYKERLPVQLNGAIQKISARKYSHAN